MNEILNSLPYDRSDVTLSYHIKNDFISIFGRIHGIYNKDLSSALKVIAYNPITIGYMLYDKKTDRILINTNVEPILNSPVDNLNRSRGTLTAISEEKISPRLCISQTRSRTNSIENNINENNITDKSSISPKKKISRSVLLKKSNSPRNTSPRNISPRNTSPKNTNIADFSCIMTKVSYLSLMKKELENKNYNEVCELYNNFCKEYGYCIEAENIYSASLCGLKK
jgi:hypothetical protein